jgi:hypothetical protein
MGQIWTNNQIVWTLIKFQEISLVQASTSFVSFPAFHNYPTFTKFVTLFFHHKLHRSQFGNNSCAKLTFHRFVWDMNVIHLLVLFEHQCHVHCLDTKVICLFILFKHECCMSIRFIYTWKSSTWLPRLNNAWHSCLNYTNPWNNWFHTNLEWTHEAYKFVMLHLTFVQP